MPEAAGRSPESPGTLRHNDRMRFSIPPGSLLLPLLMLSGIAKADPCLQLPPPSISVTRLDEAVAINLDYSYRALNAIGTELAGSGRQILGLTRGIAIVQFEISTATLVDRSGRWECASPKLTLTYGFRPLTMYVAREFPKGTCAYGEILEHEARHVATYRDHIRKIEPEITSSLKQRFLTGKPWRGPAGETRAQMQKELDTRWLPYVKLLLNRVEPAQALIDTPEEYARVAASCNGEIGRVLQRIPKE